MSKNNAPEWTPIAGLENYMSARVQRLRASVRTDEGRTKKVPALPFERWCKPCGNVVNYVVMTTRNVREAIEPQRYADFARRDAIRKGWFPWNYNDAEAYTPHIARGMGREAWEKWRAAEQTRRQDEHATKSHNYMRAWNADAELRGMQMREAMTEAVQDMVKIMRETDAKRPAGK